MPREQVKCIQAVVFLPDMCPVFTAYFISVHEREHPVFPNYRFAFLNLVTSLSRFLLIGIFVCISNVIFNLWFYFPLVLSLVLFPLCFINAPCDVLKYFLYMRFPSNRLAGLFTYNLGGCDNSTD